MNTKDAIIAATAEVMQKWSLYDESHDISVMEVRPSLWSLGYASREVGRTHWDVNIIDGVFHILSIQVTLEHRHKGHGAALYELLWQLATVLGCAEIRQYASGWTKTGEPRREYLVRHGWLEDGTADGVVYKKAGATGTPALSTTPLFAALAASASSP